MPNDLTRFLEVNRMETRNLFSGNLLRHPAFESALHWVSGDLKNTDFVMERTFFIGVYPGIGEKHLSYIGQVFACSMSGERA